jgi:tRNA threonylcarbamoyl adenosine modification protein YjeE
VSELLHKLPEPQRFTHSCSVTTAAETFGLGQQVAQLLEGGEIILFYGDLGAGKTCFIQGLCNALDVTEEVVSPTFTLVNTHDAKWRIHHLDFYRLESEHDLADVGVPDLLDDIWDGEAIGLIEWPGPILPELGKSPRFELLAEMGRGETERTWHLRALSDVSPGWSRLFPAKEDTPC